MGTYELHEHAPERKRYVDDQPVFVAAEIEDDPVIAHEIDGTAELPLDLGWIIPLCFGGNREPGTDRSLRMRVTRPELLQRPTGDHLHREIIPCHQSGDNLSQVEMAAHLPQLRRPAGGKVVLRVARAKH